MTDLDKFKELYKSIGIDVIVFHNDQENEGNQSIKLCDYYVGGDTNITKSDYFDGWPDFYTEIVFDKNGKFISQGFWE